MKHTFFLCLLSACAGPLHHQYDHGRAYEQALDTQSHLERPSAQDQDYPLSGEEGIALRANAEEAATDQEQTTNVTDTE
jgi:hypothetical protein